MKKLVDAWNVAKGTYANERAAMLRLASAVCKTQKAPSGDRFIPSVVALYVVNLVCDRPDVIGRPLSPWNSAKLARWWGSDGVVQATSPQMVHRTLPPHTLNPRSAVAVASGTMRGDIFRPGQGAADLGYAAFGEWT
jgi:hypothetical protein